MSFPNQIVSIAGKQISITIEQGKISSIPFNHHNSIAEHSKQQLEDLLTCHICFCHANNPMMCPICSKLYCQGCIKRCLQIKSECPHCRKSIKGISMMASCSRFVNELVAIVNQLIQKRVQQQICQIHNITLNYYCQNCKQPVCCQCQMFGNHHGHPITPIHQIYQKIYDELREKLTNFKNNLKEKESTLKHLQTHLTQIKKIKDKQLSQIEQYTDLYRNKIIQNSTKESDCMQESLTHYNHIINELIQLEQSFNLEVQQAKENGTFIISQSIENQINQISTKNVQFQVTKTKNVLEQVIPLYIERKFVISKFSLKKKQRSIIFSPIQEIEGCQWRLKIYPNGNQNVQNIYLSIFIEMVSSLQKSVTYEYQIELVNKKNPNQRMIREYSSTFEAGQSWGYNKYIKLDNLFKQGYVDSEDQLQIHYYLRYPFYYNIYKQKQLYIESLDKKILKQEDQIKHLRLLAQNI